jgi:hypothetical protein
MNNSFLSYLNISIAIAPSMLLTWGAVAWLRRFFEQRTGRRIGKTGAPIRHATRYTK